MGEGTRGRASLLPPKKERGAGGKSRERQVKKGEQQGPQKKKKRCAQKGTPTGRQSLNRRKPPRQTAKQKFCSLVCVPCVLCVRDSWLLGGRSLHVTRLGGGVGGWCLVCVLFAVPWCSFAACVALEKGVCPLQALCALSPWPLFSGRVALLSGMAFLCYVCTVSIAP